MLPRVDRSMYARVVTYGVQNDADYRADDIRLGTQHSRFKLLHQGREYEVKTNLIALYNIYNLLAAIAAMHESGLSLKKYWIVWIRWIRLTAV